MGQRFAIPLIRTSVNITPEFYELCKNNRIKFSEAMRIGISIMLAEKGISEYDNNLNIVRKMYMFQKIAEEASSKAEELKNEKNTKE